MTQPPPPLRHSARRLGDRGAGAPGRADRPPRRGAGVQRRVPGARPGAAAASATGDGWSLARLADGAVLAIAVDPRVARRARMLATLSHEIRTPLNGVLGMAGLLAETRLDATQRLSVRPARLRASTCWAWSTTCSIRRLDAGRLELEAAPGDVEPWCGASANCSARAPTPPGSRSPGARGARPGGAGRRRAAAPDPVQPRRQRGEADPQRRRAADRPRARRRRGPRAAAPGRARHRPGLWRRRRRGCSRSSNRPRTAPRGRRRPGPGHRPPPGRRFRGRAGGAEPRGRGRLFWFEADSPARVAVREDRRALRWRA